MTTQVTTGLKVRKSVDLTIDGQAVTALEGATLLEVCRANGKEIP
ncbi:MAG: 2Fe-2S iron-sulfur cluster-binding protein, partial [Actinomycetota bacterium]